MIICNKYNLPVYYINNSSCCYSFTLLFLWGFAGSEKVIHTCLLLIKYYKMISIIHQALERRIPNFIHLWWLMIMFSMRCKERSNALSVITCFKLTYITVNSLNTGTHSAGHFWDNFLSLLLLPLCVWKQSVPEHCILSTGVTQDCPNVMWLQVSHVNDYYSVIFIFLN